MEDKRKVYDTVEPDFIDILLKLLRKWKVLVVVCAIFFVAGCAYSFLTQRQDMIDNPVVNKQDYQSIDELSDYNKNNINLANHLRIMYYGLLDRNEKTVALTYDAGNMYVGDVCYYFDNFKNCSLVKTVTNNLINEDEFVSLIQKCLGLDANKSIEGIVAIVNSEDQDSSASNLLVEYRVRYPDETVVINLLDNLNTYIEKRCKELQSQFTFSYSKAQEYLSYLYEPDFAKWQSDSLNEPTTYLMKAMELENGFDNLTSRFYKTHYLGATLEPLEQLPEKTISYVKVFLYGVIFAGFIFIVIFISYGIGYIFNNKVKTVREVLIRYSLPLIGTIKSESYVNDEVNEKIIAREKKIIDKEYLDCYLKDLEGKKYYLLTSSFDEKINNQINTIVDNKKFEIVTNIYNDRKWVKKLKESQGVVIVVNPEKTEREDLENNIETCDLNDIEIVGVLGIY